MKTTNLSLAFILFTTYFQAYVQQLETGRMKLAQLEQELERARGQVKLQSFLNVENSQNFPTPN